MARKFHEAVVGANGIQIGSQSLDTNCVAAKNIQANVITASKIGNYSIGATQLATDSVTNVKMAANAINTAEITASCISMAKVNYATATVSVTTAGTAEDVAHGLASTPSLCIIVAADGTAWVTTYDETTASVDCETSGTAVTILSIV